MIEWIGQRFQEFHFGHMLINKVTALVTMTTLIITISIKWNFDPTILIIISVPALVLIIWVTGYVLDRTGIRAAFMNSQFKDVEIK